MHNSSEQRSIDTIKDHNKKAIRSAIADLKLATQVSVDTNKVGYTRKVTDPIKALLYDKSGKEFLVEFRCHMEFYVRSNKSVDNSELKIEIIDVTHSNNLVADYWFPFKKYSFADARKIFVAPSLFVELPYNDIGIGSAIASTAHDMRIFFARSFSRLLGATHIEVAISDATRENKQTSDKKFDWTTRRGEDLYGHYQVDNSGNRIYEAEIKPFAFNPILNSTWRSRALFRIFRR